MKKLKNLKSFFWVLFIAAFIGLASSIPNTYIQAIDATITRYFIWGNDLNRNAATADSIMGFVNGNDTATMIPLPVGGSGFWEEDSDSLHPSTVGINVWLLDSVYFSGLPIGEKDSILYIDKDTIFKGPAPSGGSSYWIPENDTLVPDGYNKISVDSIILTGTTGKMFDGYGRQWFGYDNNYQTFGSYARVGVVMGDGYDQYRINNGAGNSDHMWESANAQFMYWDDSDDELFLGYTKPLAKIKIGGSGAPDSSLTVEKGGNFGTDILVGGGWQAWTPTITFTGGTLTTTPTVTARYTVTNNVVTVNMYIRGENDSGNTLTGIQITPPFYPPDINSYANFMLAVSSASSPVNSIRYTCLLDMSDAVEANRIIKTNNSFAILNSADFNFVVDGTYEITGK